MCEKWQMLDQWDFTCSMNNDNYINIFLLRARSNPFDTPLVIVILISCPTYHKLFTLLLCRPTWCTLNIIINNTPSIHQISGIDGLVSKVLSLVTLGSGAALIQCWSNVVDVGLALNQCCSLLLSVRDWSADRYRPVSTPVITMGSPRGPLSSSVVVTPTIHTQSPTPVTKSMLGVDTYSESVTSSNYRVIVILCPFLSIVFISRQKLEYDQGPIANRLRACDREDFTPSGPYKLTRCC